MLDEPNRGSWHPCKHLVVAYCLTFFCRSGEVNGSSALAAFLSRLTETGDAVLIRHGAAGYAEEVDARELATDDGSGTAAAGFPVQFICSTGPVFCCPR